MEQPEVTKRQLESAKKNIEWMERSGPSVAARNLNLDVSAAGETDTPQGVALPPHERDCGRSHPISGTNSEDLRDWCAEHET